MYNFDNITIKKVVVGPIATNCYIVDSFSNKVTIIDPGDEPQTIINAIGSKTIDKVFLTHGHFDHISAILGLKKKYDFKVFINELDKEMLLDSQKNGSYSFFNRIVIPDEIIKTFKDDDIITSSDLDFKIIHTPGHSKGSSCIALDVDDNHYLFTGDTLFENGYGRTDFYGGNFDELVNSLRKLLKLPFRYNCLPGHGGETKTGR